MVSCGNAWSCEQLSFFLNLNFEQANRVMQCYYSRMTERIIKYQYTLENVKIYIVINDLYKTRKCCKLKVFYHFDAAQKKNSASLKTSKEI